MVFAKLKNQLSPTFYWEKLGPPQPQPGLNLPLGARIPDWRSYKVSEFTPELQKLEKRLAAKGLKDPWIRNEVWRFDTRVWGTKVQRHAWIWRGLGSAVLVTATLIAMKETILKKDDHGHHDDYPLLKELASPKAHHH